MRNKELYQARRTGGILCGETCDLLRLLYGKGARNQAGRGPQMDGPGRFQPHVVKHSGSRSFQ